MQGLFITGTNTGVGKTSVGANIARQLTDRNITVIPRKPIESGCIKENGELIPQDALALRRAAQYVGDLSEICPFRFEPSVSPLRAAHLANKTLTTEQLAAICFKGSENGFLLVEGAGGFYSPLAENGLNADLAVALQLPVLLVINNQLGALSQALLNAEAIQMRGLQLAAIILNTIENNETAMIDNYMNNAADLREYLHCPIYTVAYSAEGEAKLPADFIDSLTVSTSAKAPAQAIRQGYTHQKIST